MTTFRVIDQIVTVIEVSYNIDAPDEDAAIEIAQTEAKDEAPNHEVHRETVRRYSEIIDAEEITS